MAATLERFSDERTFEFGDTVVSAYGFEVFERVKEAHRTHDVGGSGLKTVRQSRWGERFFLPN